MLEIEGPMLMSKFVCNMWMLVFEMYFCSVHARFNFATCSVFRERSLFKNSGFSFGLI